MEAIKIVPLDSSLLEDTDTINESEVSYQFQEVQKIVNTPDDVSIRAAVRESTADIVLAGGTAAVGAGLALFGIIRAYIKKKYSIQAKKILDQSKDLNDAYTKVEYLLKNDKMARFKHRNDLITATVKYVVLCNKKDGKYYNVAIDQLCYNTDYIVQAVRDMMENLDRIKDENESTLISEWADKLIGDLKQSFDNNHWWIECCEPLIKSEVHNSIKLEKALMYYKNTFSNLYNYIYAINKMATTQMTYLQFLEKGYKTCMSTYGTTKDRKDAIDRIFKYLISNATMSITFNTKCMDAYTEEIKWYADELKRIYDILRN